MVDKPQSYWDPTENRNPMPYEVVRQQAMQAAMRPQLTPMAALREPADINMLEDPVSRYIARWLDSFKIPGQVYQAPGGVTTEELIPQAQRLMFKGKTPGGR